MWLVQPVPDEEADGLLRELYDQDLKEDGYVANTTRVWSHRPELATPFRQVLRTIRSHVRLRTYELITLATARAIGCVY